MVFLRKWITLFESIYNVNLFYTKTKRSYGRRILIALGISWISWRLFQNFPFTLNSAGFLNQLRTEVKCENNKPSEKANDKNDKKVSTDRFREDLLKLLDLQVKKCYQHMDRLLTEQDFLLGFVNHSEKESYLFGDSFIDMNELISLSVPRGGERSSKSTTHLNHLTVPSNLDINLNVNEVYFRKYSTSKDLIENFVNQAYQLLSIEQSAMQNIENNFGWKKVFSNGKLKLWRRICRPNFDYLSNNVDNIENQHYQITVDDCDHCYQFDHERSKRTYEYCVIGHYDDISCDTFMSSYVDIDYRKSWDKYTIRLEILCDNSNKNEQFINWVFQNPFPLSAPHQYVYYREMKRDSARNFISLVNWSVDDPKSLQTELLQAGMIDNEFLEEKNSSLVSYRSVLLVVPQTTFHQVPTTYSILRPRCKLAKLN